MLCLLLKFAFQPVNLNESTSTKRYHQTLPLNASSKRKHKTQAQNASTNGGDASRVGKDAAII